MNNVIPLRPDPLRQAYDATDKLNDTKLSPGQQQLVDSIAVYLEKAIEARELERCVMPTSLSDATREFRRLIDQQGGYNFEALKQEQDNGEDDLFPA